MRVPTSTDEMIAVSAALALDPEKFGNPALKNPNGGRGGLRGIRDPQGAGGFWSIFSGNLRPIRLARCSMAATSEP